MDPITLIVQIAVSYLMGRLQQPNGPRVKDLAAGLGDYGVPLPRLFGEIVRIVGVVLVQGAIKETVHKHKPKTDYLFGIVGALLPAVKTYTYSDTLALIVGDRTDDEPVEGLAALFAGGKTIFRSSESSVVSESLDADGRLIFRKYGKNRFCKSVTIYGGGFDQVGDPVLNALPGIDPQPGYRGRAYVVIEDLQLEQFGNAVPVPIEALVEVAAGQTLAKLCEMVCAAAGIDPTRDLSTTALADQVVRGYAVTDESTCWDALKPLLPAFAFDVAEVAGQIRGYRRSQSMRATIPASEMGAHQYGDSPPERYNFKRTMDVDLPQETTLTWIDPARDYQPNSATSRRSEGSARSNITAKIPLVLTADEGASATALLHWDAWLGRTALNFTLTDAWIGLSTGVAYAVPAADQVVPYRIARKLRGADGVIAVEALSDEQVTYSARVAGSSGAVEPPVSTTFAETRIVAIDGAILADGDDEYGFYLVAGGGADYWDGGAIAGSVDGVNYDDPILVTEATVVGDVSGVLAAGSTSGLDDALDTTSVLTVELMHAGMTLESASDDELDAGANLAFVGKDGVGEYLQFKTAAFVSGATWQLTDLRRGRRGSDWAMPLHDAGEEFALLSDGGVLRIAQSTTDGWGVPLWFKAMSTGQDLSDVAATTFTNAGEGKRPYSPVEVEGSWDGSYNLTGTFTARSRLDAGGLGIDDREEFEVEILNATPVRTITVTAETFDYSAADQVSDGLTPGGLVDGRVRQTSDVNDGRWRQFVLIGPATSVIEMEDGTTPIETEIETTTKPFELEA